MMLLALLMIFVSYLFRLLEGWISFSLVKHFVVNLWIPNMSSRFLIHCAHAALPSMKPTALNLLQNLQFIKIDS